MNEFVESKIVELREDYAQNSGEPFSHFFCPILFKDEDVPLCQAHIINRAFSDSARACTVQRQDVDGFFGSRFESDFIDIQNHNNLSPVEILTDSNLSKRFNPRILLNDKPVNFLINKRGIPKQFTRVKVDGKEISVPFGLEMHPDEVIATEGKGWEVEISRDVRVPMLVSVIKAAYLTLFDLLGYRYALSPSGIFVGRQILGEFFFRNQDKPKREVLRNAHLFFREFVHMVRPLVSCDFECKGTITDSTFLICIGSSGFAWGLIVFVKTSNVIHGVLTPVFEQPDQAATFLDFLRNDNTSIQVATCHFEEDKWKISKGTKPLIWLKEGTLYP